MKIAFENGLTLLVRENRAVPLVNSDIWVRCGSASETPPISGASHFLEHMVFKGSDRLAPGEYDRRIENLGGELNAATSNDYTHYYVNVPSRHFAKAFDDLADVVTCASLDPKEFENERLVILEEIRRRQDNPQGFLFQKVFEETWSDGPYKRPVLGYPETVGEMTRQQLFDYHRSHYRPEALTVVVAGDVATSDVIGAVSRAFGTAPVAQVQSEDSKKSPASSASLAPIEKGAGADAAAETAGTQIWGQRREYAKDVNEAYLVLAFPAPGLAHDGGGDSIIADLAAHILGGTQASRLWQAVREKKRLVSSVSLHNYTLKNDGMFIVMASLEPKNMEEAIAAIRAEIERFARRGPTAAELARARKAIANHFLYETETNSGQCSMSGFLYTLTGSTRFEEQYLDIINRTEARSIRDCARRYLKPETSNVFAVVPQKKTSDAPKMQ